ncbi:hypothetical protein EJB05_53699 [Eragrostis curvula]|uniref:DNA (cytosine-5-)-methyltransferase n=1 Tax=Eragrostis curvula TaxID=38414 RepID=A0A5J9SPD8_9POAL|nr:hypothetical protein EJB05_53699 [Eragrostis curvula]
MADLGAYSDEEFNWDSSDGDGEVAGSINGTGTSAAASRNHDAPGSSTLAWQSSSSVENFVRMGFERNMVLKAMKETGAGDADSLVSLLLTYKEIGSELECTSSGYPPLAVENEGEDDKILENGFTNSDDSGAEDFLKEVSHRDLKLESIVSMGFPEAEAKMAIARCGPDAAVSVLIDSIQASQTAGEHYLGDFSNHEDNSNGEKKKKRLMEGNKRKRTGFRDEVQGSRGPLYGNHDSMPLPNPMVGFNLPIEPFRSGDRWPSLPTQAIGPPYFYYENVACAPKGVWTTISRFLYDVRPEFVDSSFLCATNRKRGYVHNLPVKNRSPLIPLPPKSIFEAFPRTEKWWATWDPRRKFNCLQTCTAPATLIEHIRSTLASNEDPPPPRVQKFVLEECRKWNLIWIGRNKVAPLEPHEMELLLGFPPDHTRGITKTERYRSLGNAFQVDTVAYHLSVLKELFPDGMNVLSLFSGIGGAEVALHKLGIRLKNVLSVEKSKANRTVLRSWWDDNGTGTLYEIDDIQKLSSELIEVYVRRFGGFDLVIGGSPCNNLAGSNRHHRDGLDGEHSSLFYHYVRILEAVKSAMQRM